MEINKKILTSAFIIGLLALGLGYGTYSYFSDTEESTDNVFTSGTIDLQLSNDGTIWTGGVTATWSISGWAPGDYYEDVLYMRNVGTTGALVGRFKGLDLVETDYLTGTTDIADYILITEIYYTEEGAWMPWNLAGYYATVMGDGVAPLTLREFCDPAGYSMVFWAGIGWPGDSGIDYFQAGGTPVEMLRLGFTFDPAAGNDYQGDSATFTLRVTADDDPTILGKGSDCYGY